MKCDICGIDEVREVVTIAGNTYALCEYDLIFADRMIHSRKYHEMLNIAWGAGRIDYGSWCFIRDFLRDKEIKEVLELGGGLSSELFVIEGLDLISFDVLVNHIHLLQNLNPIKNKSSFYQYDYGTIPPIKELYPNRTWDFIFIDGPQERSREVRIAMEVGNKYIYLHDPNMGEQSFFPNNNWKCIHSDKLYEKVLK